MPILLWQLTFFPSRRLRRLVKISIGSAGARLALLLLLYLPLPVGLPWRYQREFSPRPTSCLPRNRRAARSDVRSAPKRSAFSKTRGLARTGIGEQITRRDRAYRSCAPEPRPEERRVEGTQCSKNECIPFPLFPEATGAQVTGGQGSSGSTDATDDVRERTVDCPFTFSLNYKSAAARLAAKVIVISRNF